MLMLEKLLNPEVKKNVVKQVATPANMRADGLMDIKFEHIAYESIMNPNYRVQILTGPVSKTREITSNANEKIRLGRESSPCNHLAILGSHPIIINKSYYRSHRKIH
jgi:hypothetical protein